LSYTRIDEEIRRKALFRQDAALAEAGAGKAGCFDVYSSSHTECRRKKLGVKLTNKAGKIRLKAFFYWRTMPHIFIYGSRNY
jgi:hypothetical protein